MIDIPQGETASRNSPRWLSSTLSTHLVMIGVLAITSVSIVATKIGVDHIRPIPLSAARISGSAICLIIAATLLGHRIHRMPRLSIVAPAALVGVVINSVFFTVSLAMGTAVNLSLIAGLAPMFTALIVMALAFRMLPWQQIVAIPLGLIGVLAVVSPQLPSSGLGASNLVALGVPMTWALFLVLISTAARETPATVLAAWTMVIGLLILLPIAVFQTLDGQDRWGQAMGAVAVSAVFGPGMSYSAYLWCIPRMGTTGTAIYGYLQPPVGAAAAVVVLHETFALAQIVGAALILAAVLLANRRS